MRSFSRRAYDNGIVIVQCPSCSVKHLVADRLGWFGEPGSVEDFMKQRGGGKLPTIVPADNHLTAPNLPFVRLKPGSTDCRRAGGRTRNYAGSYAQVCNGMLLMALSS